MRSSRLVHSEVSPWVGAGVAVLLLGGCRGGPDIFFQGRSEGPVASPAEILEAPELPRDAARLGKLIASCEAVEEWGAFRGRSLVDVDCTERRLRQMLREAASRLGGDVLSGLECSGEGSVRCRAILGRMARRGAPSARVHSGNPDIGGTRGSGVRVDFAPLVADIGRPPRDAENVRELPVLLPSHRVVGSFQTACDECSELETRDALRLAAARLGASDVIGVRCYAWGPGYHCMGTAAVTEVEP